MPQVTLLSLMVTHSRVLGCCDTFLTEIIREALSLARFEPEILSRLSADIDSIAKESKKVRLTDELWLE